MYVISIYATHVTNSPRSQRIAATRVDLDKHTADIMFKKECVYSMLRYYFDFL
jgi:hypothetical protein